MRRLEPDLKQRLLVGLWFAIVVGMTARLGDDFRLYSRLRQQRCELQLELQNLDHQLAVLQNKLRYLHTPDGIRLVRRIQFHKASGEKLFVLEDGLPPISIMDLLAGGFEEWNTDERAGKPERNKWLFRISRHWQRLRGERYH
ncbi:MAG: hypothetical protein N2116_05095 [Armatimonadetes bacterium]|nr:hypothetical protein [Armatimonadota bacterium]